MSIYGKKLDTYGKVAKRPRKSRIKKVPVRRNQPTRISHGPKRTEGGKPPSGPHRLPPRSTQIKKVTRTKPKITRTAHAQKNVRLGGPVIQKAYAAAPFKLAWETTEHLLKHQKDLTPSQIAKIKKDRGGFGPGGITREQVQGYAQYDRSGQFKERGEKFVVGSPSNIQFGDPRYVKSTVPAARPMIGKTITRKDRKTGKDKVVSLGGSERELQVYDSKTKTRIPYHKASRAWLEKDLWIKIFGEKNMPSSGSGAPGGVGIGRRAFGDTRPILHSQLPVKFTRFHQSYVTGQDAYNLVAKKRTTLKAAHTRKKLDTTKTTANKATGKNVRGNFLNIGG